MDKILLDIGVDNIGYKEIRESNNAFLSKYGILNTTPSATGTSASSTASSTKATGQSTSAATSSSSGRTSKTHASNDPRSVIDILKKFHPAGKNREKLVTILNEIKTLDLCKHPHAFCFLLRCMFELSAKAYCMDHKGDGLLTSKANGEDRTLVDILRDVTSYMTKNETDKAKVKRLHGAMTELAKPKGILSITSLNQLVHNSSFSIQPADICILFGNIYPLLEDINQ